MPERQGVRICPEPKRPTVSGVSRLALVHSRNTISPTGDPVPQPGHPKPPPLLRKFRSGTGREEGEPAGRRAGGGGRRARVQALSVSARASEPPAAPSHGLRGPPGQQGRFAFRAGRSSRSTESRSSSPGRSLPQLQPPLNESAICYLSRPGGEVPIRSRLLPDSFNRLNTGSHRSPRDSPGAGLRGGRGTTPTPTPAGPVLSVCLSLSRSLPVCLYLFVSVSLVLPRCLSLSCARAHTLGWGLSPQPLPKCHLESKCNNLLCDRPESPWRNARQEAALSSPARCSRACGREQGRIWPVEMTGTVVPSPFQDPVAIRIPSPSRPLGPARTAHPGRGAPVPGLPGSPGGRECAPGARRRRRSGRAGPGDREPNPQSLRRQEATTARRARAAQGTATAAAAGLGSRPQPRGAARRYLSAARSLALDPCVRPPVGSASFGVRTKGASWRPGQVFREVTGSAGERSRGGCGSSRP